MTERVPFPKTGTIFRRRLRSGLFHSAVLSFCYVLLALEQANAGWVDPDTKPEFLKTDALTKADDKKYELVFSDEFDEDGRDFKDGSDPRWTSLDKNDYTNTALHYYSSDNVRTSNGVLNITTNFKDNSFIALNEETKKEYVETKYIQSAMVQGWNKFCFTGGIVEISAKLPGKAKVGGLWPALWLLGNLGRATYVGSTDFVWPWSYNTCDPASLLEQEINACTRVNHFGMTPFQGRGSPEIDILEAMPGEPGRLPNTHIQRPYFSTSLQISPGKREHRPIMGDLPKKKHWYTGLEYGNTTNLTTEINPFFYGTTLVHKPKSKTYQSDALSANTRIDERHFESQHVYRLEWEPSNAQGVGGYIKWYIDGEFLYGINAESLKLTGALMPSEPLYIILNNAVSSSWGFPMPCPEGCDCDCFECGNPDCDCGLPIGFCKNIPASFEIDYVRVYQAVDHPTHEVGCSTERHPSKKFIQGNAKLYQNKGDRQPLKHIVKGGGRCHKLEECGGISRGECQKNRCVCKETSTGPMCLAHDGYDDGAYKPKVPSFIAQKIMIPYSMAVILISLLVFFCLTLGFEIKRKNKEHFDTLNHSGSPRSFASKQREPGKSNQAVYSYQHSESVGDARISEGAHLLEEKWQQRETGVSYCVIDGRLIDQ